MGVPRLGGDALGRGARSSCFAAGTGDLEAPPEQSRRPMVISSPPGGKGKGTEAASPLAGEEEPGLIANGSGDARDRGTLPGSAAPGSGLLLARGWKKPY